MLSPAGDDPLTKLGLKPVEDEVGGVAPGPILLEPELSPVDIPADIVRMISKNDMSLVLFSWW